MWLGERRGTERGMTLLTCLMVGSQLFLAFWKLTQKTTVNLLRTSVVSFACLMVTVSFCKSWTTLHPRYNSRGPYELNMKQVLLEVGYEFLTNFMITCTNHSIVHVDRVVIIEESQQVQTRNLSLLIATCGGMPLTRNARCVS